MKKLLSLVLVLILALLAVSSFTEAAEVAEAAEDMEAVVTEIQKYGNFVLSLTGSELLEAGYAYGDIVTVTINGTGYDMPVGSNFSDVDQGSMVCRVAIDPDLNEDRTILAIYMGELATVTGIATKEKTEEEPGYIWHLNEGIQEPIRVSITMKERGGYYDQYVSHHLVRSEKREDYPELSDEEFANFRAVTTPGIGPGKLYRSSSPVNPEIRRNLYADRASAAAGIRTFINLEDNGEVMREYEGFDSSYYSTQAIIPLNLGMIFTGDDFRSGLAKGLRFMIDHQAPYMVHCLEGKDRAGFVIAVLECLMGATAEEVIADYMVSFFNYYGVKPGTKQYDIIAGSNICKSLATAFRTEDIRDADLQAAAEAYLLEIGLSAEEIARIRAALAE